jgi:hypothetical protein
MDKLNKTLGEAWKTVVAFGGLLVVQLVTLLFQSGEPFPADLAGWGRVIGLAIVGAAAVYAKGQEPNDKQLVDHADKVDQVLQDHGYKRVPLADA